MKQKPMMTSVMALAAFAFSVSCAGAGTMRIVHSIDFPVDLATGFDITWDGEHLWSTMSDPVNGLMTYELDPSDGSVISSFQFPAVVPGTSRVGGHAWDGTHLWTSDNSTLRIYKLDPEAGTVLGTLAAPVTRDDGAAPELGGLAWDGEHLWCGTIAGWSSRMIEVDPADGSVGRSYFTKGYPRALESDGTFIWNATDNRGRRSGIVYKYRLSDGMYVSQFDTHAEWGLLSAVTV